MLFNKYKYNQDPNLNENTNSPLTGQLDKQEVPMLFNKHKQNKDPNCNPFNKDTNAITTLSAKLGKQESQ